MKYNNETLEKCDLLRTCLSRYETLTIVSLVVVLPDLFLWCQKEKGKKKSHGVKYSLEIVFLIALPLLNLKEPFLEI